MSGKIKNLEEILSIVSHLKENGRKIVFTNGCFDLLHIGHLRTLQKAKSLGDILIVGVNSDDSVKQIKGRSRPITPENERAEIIAALECVDYVVIFSERDPIKLIKAIKPDVHVKGGDYDMNKLPEAKIVRSYGGKVVLSEKISNHSTTEIIRRIINIFGKQEKNEESH
jgi:rfaE bifunctional protein nucleotidyltransferase chain/domain